MATVVQPFLPLSGQLCFLLMRTASACTADRRASLLVAVRQLWFSPFCPCAHGQWVRRLVATVVPWSVRLASVQRTHRRSASLYYWQLWSALFASVLMASVGCGLARSGSGCSALIDGAHLLRGGLATVDLLVLPQWRLWSDPLRLLLLARTASALHCSARWGFGNCRSALSASLWAALFPAHANRLGLHC